MDRLVWSRFGAFMHGNLTKKNGLIGYLVAFHIIIHAWMLIIQQKSKYALSKLILNPFLSHPLANLAFVHGNKLDEKRYQIALQNTTVVVAFASTTA